MPIYNLGSHIFKVMLSFVLYKSSQMNLYVMFLSFPENWKSIL